MIRKHMTYLAGLFCILNTSLVFSSDIGIGVFLDSVSLNVNDQLYVNTKPQPNFFITAFNNKDTVQSVDVHIVVITTDGTVYEYPDWNTNFKPWLSSFSVPANFQLPLTLVGNLDSFPSKFEPGAYKIIAALTHPGTLDILFMSTDYFTVSDENKPLPEGVADIIFGDDTSPLVFTGAFSKGYSNADVDFTEARRLAELQFAEIDACNFIRNSNFDLVYQFLLILMLAHHYY